MKRKVYLEGEMGSRFGKEFNIAAESFTDVFRCLKCNFSGFMPYLQECHEKNIGFILEVEGKPIKHESEALLIYKEGDMIITPVPAGSKSGPAKILAAVAVTVMTAGMAAAFAPGAVTAASVAAGGIPIYTTGFMSAFGSGAAFGASLMGAASTLPGLIALGVAVNLAMTGIQQMMAPDPSTDTQEDESYIFQGSKQNISEGDPVPVLYGELRIPGRTVSFHTRSERNQFYNQDQRATSNESNGQTYDQAGGQVSGGSSGGASAPMGGSGTIDWSVLESSLGR